MSKGTNIVSWGIMNKVKTRDCLVDEKPLLRGGLSENERWYAVQSLPKREAGAQMQLNNQGFQTFLPRIKATRRHARKIENILAPFFPRYLFVVLNMERDQWRSVNGTYGVSRLVMQGDRPLPVPHGIVEPMIECADERGLMHFDAANEFHVGQKVEIMAGPLSRQIGEIVRLDAGGRVQLLLDFMGQQTRVKVSGEDLIPTAA